MTGPMIGVLVLAGVQVAAIVGLGVAILRHLAARDVREQAERRELLTRIQHPQLVPVGPRPPAAEAVDRPPAEPDETHLVGVAQRATEPPTESR